MRLKTVNDSFMIPTTFNKNLILASSDSECPGSMDFLKRDGTTYRATAMRFSLISPAMKWLVHLNGGSNGLLTK